MTVPYLLSLKAMTLSFIELSANKQNTPSTVPYLLYYCALLAFLERLDFLDLE